MTGRMYPRNDSTSTIEQVLSRFSSYDELFVLVKQCFLQRSIIPDELQETDVFQQWNSWHLKSGLRTTMSHTRKNCCRLVGARRRKEIPKEIIEGTQNWWNSVSYVVCEQNFQAPPVLFCEKNHHQLKLSVGAVYCLIFFLLNFDS